MKTTKLNKKAMFNELKLLERACLDLTENSRRFANGIDTDQSPLVEATLDPVKIEQLFKSVEASVAADKLKNAWTEAGSPTDSNAIFKLLKAQGIDDKLLYPAFKAAQVSLSVTADTDATAKKADEPTKKADDVTTGDPALDDKMHTLVSKMGKEDAITYLKSLQAKNKEEPPAEEPITVGKDKIMPNDPRYPRLKAAADKAKPVPESLEESAVNIRRLVDMIKD